MASSGVSYAIAATAPTSIELPFGVVIRNSGWYTALILFMLMVAAVILACVMVVGSLRSRTSSVTFKGILWFTLLIAPQLVTYAVGQMTTTAFDPRYLTHQLLPIWGILLLAWVGSYGSISAFQLENNETSKLVYSQGFAKCVAVFAMVLANVPDFKLPVNLLWVLLILTPFMFPRVNKRADAMTCANKSDFEDGVGKRVEIVAEFMEWDVQKTTKPLVEATDPQAAAADPDPDPDPGTMIGYRYLVGLKNLWNKKYNRIPPCYRRDFDQEMEDGDIVTTEDIWVCGGELLTSGDSDGKLKDTCLSFALFWMLLRRYTGHTLPEVVSQKEKTWKFVREGLIPKISTATCERTFRVIEQEIDFLYDYFYTKNFVTYLNGFWSIIFQFAVMATYLVIAQLILNDNKKTEHLIISDYVPPFRLDVLITKIVIFALCVLELAIIVHYIFITPWSKVGWVCTYVRKQGSDSMKDRCQRWVIEKICGLSLGRNTKHWKRELDQYSLIKHHDYVSFKRFLSCFLNIVPFKFYEMANKGRELRKPIPFSADLKEAILSFLHTNGRELTNGITALKNNYVEADFSWACKLETHTQTIMVWHIATAYCKLNYKNEDPANGKKSDCFVVAKSLSRYCAYLVAFKPQLIPDHTNTLLNIFDNVINEANVMFEGCSNMKDKYDKMKNTGDQFEDTILRRGIRLGKSLVNKLSTAESLSKMLGEFWAEQLLYLAPSEDVDVHIMEVANGGELITHLWALLTHAGILNRSVSPPASISM